MKSDFVSLVSHEIRSPLTSIHMQLKVIGDGLAGEVSDKQQEILSRASEKINALITMSGELLDLSKIESGLIHMERQVLSLQPLLEDQVSLCQARAQARQIQLTLDMAAELPEVNANKTNMEEVFSNLISNALNYTPDGGRIVVSAGVQNDQIRISVRDNGIGIAPEDMERIFNRFYRVKNADTRQVIGTGLGLPIVKSIIDAHHGRIQVESQVGEGSTFSVYLPVAED
jgi:signal transduction histidine kinase